MRQMRIYLQTLGKTELQTTQGVVPLSSREAALLTFVCRKPLSRASRSEIVALFWPSIDPAKARHSLSQLVYALKRRVPELQLVGTPDYLVLSGLDLDLQAISNEIAADNKQAALDKYHGRFLPNDDLTSSLLRDWRDEVEEEVALTLADVIQEQSHVCAAADLQRIIQISEALLLAHPHLVGAQVALIEATARTGQVQKAERIYRSVAGKNEDAAAPFPPISSFQLRSAASSESRTVPFAGREDELACLLECWDRTCSGEGQVVVLLGEPGIGKTRLADQCLRRAAIRGGAVWITNCCAATQRLPYSVVNDLMREHLNPGSSILEPLPVPAAGKNADVATTEHSQDEYRQRLTEYLTSNVIERSTHQPLAILVDDAQWADEYTALLVAYWAYRLRRHRVMLMLTVRTHEAEPPPDWILSDLGRPVRLSLGGISVSAAESIVTAFERNNNVVFERSTKDAVLWQSGGRPFLLLEALASVLNDGAPSGSKIALSEPAESLLLRRFRNMPPDAACVVGLLAVWGRPVPEPILRSLSTLPEDRFASALNVLHTRGVAHLRDNMVSFPHDLMRGTAYRTLLPATRVLNHRKIASKLVCEKGPDGLIAQHYSQAGDADLAGEYSMRAAADALATHSLSDYEFYCNLCIQTGALRFRSQAALSLARYLVRVGRSNEIDTLLPLIDQETEDLTILTSLLILERDLASGDKSVTNILSYAKRIATNATWAEDSTRASLAATLFCLAFDAYAGEIDYAALAGASEERVDALRDSHFQVDSLVSVWHAVTQDVYTGLSMATSTLNNLNSNTAPNTRAACLYSHGTLLLLAGRVNEARTQLDAALELAHECGDVRRQISTYINNGVALMESGEMAAARQSLEKAATATNAHFRIRCYTNLAIFHYEDGDFALAAQAAEAVLSMNASYQSPTLESTSCAILGLMALANRNHEIATNYAMLIKQHSWISLDDTSYAAAFVSRMLSIAGKRAEALLLLSNTIHHTKRRNVLCTMRLECEKATLLIDTEPDAAYRLARDLHTDADLLGAERVKQRAQQILTEVRVHGRS